MRSRLARGSFLAGSRRASLSSSLCEKLFRRSFHGSARLLAAPKATGADVPMNKLRNIGISAHIDSGKTTLTERILFYTGRIRAIHEVKGKDGVGAKMDFMDLEREKGITIQSAATYAQWGDHHFNIIDTPGHVDFTIEVERALRVLDGAILVVCAVGGVQSQTITVDRQMNRYSVPRICFINKLDRLGANPLKVIENMRKKLGMNAVALQLPIGLENLHKGVVDLVKMKALYFEGDRGIDVEERDIPEALLEEAKERRQTLLEHLADADETILDKMMEDLVPTEEELTGAIRRATISRSIVPVMMGTAFKNKGVQPVLDAVCNYLPNPTECVNKALDMANEEEEFPLPSDPKGDFVGLAFKLEEGRFGQLTYLRVYQGTLKKGDTITNIRDEKKIKINRLVRMHANEMVDVDSAKAGEITALFGVDCHSGDTFTNGKVSYSMTSMHIPDPVISMTISTKKSSDMNFMKALKRFQKEDPTFRITHDKESGETIASGMGELHLEIYKERLSREFGVTADLGRPKVAYRETIKREQPFDFTLKKQTGGQGQFARIIGQIEPIDFEDYDDEELAELEFPEIQCDFSDETIGGTIPPQYIPSIRKGFAEVLDKGPLIKSPVRGVRMVIKDGAFHPVDSSDMAFKNATIYLLKTAFEGANPQLLEPLMKAEIVFPQEFQGAVTSSVNKRIGVILNTEFDGEYTVLNCEVPLANMFQYATELRSLTQGKGEFSLEYTRHQPVPRSAQQQLIKQYASAKEEEA